MLCVLRKQSYAELNAWDGAMLAGAALCLPHGVVLHVHTCVRTECMRASEHNLLDS